MKGPLNFACFSLIFQLPPVFNQFLMPSFRENQVITDGVIYTVFTACVGLFGNYIYQVLPLNQWISRFDTVESIVRAQPNARPLHSLVVWLILPFPWMVFRSVRQLSATSSNRTTPPLKILASAALILIVSGLMLWLALWGLDFSTHASIRGRAINSLVTANLTSACMFIGFCTYASHIFASMSVVGFKNFIIRGVL